MFPVHELHKDTNLWGEDATEFKPERFSPEKISKVHPYAYLPFSKGPRLCPGKKYAWMSMKTLLSQFLMKYKVSTSMKYEELHFKIELTTTIKQGFMMKVEKRQK